MEVEPSPKSQLYVFAAVLVLNVVLNGSHPFTTVAVKGGYVMLSTVI